MKHYTALLACILLLSAGCGENRDTASQDKVRELLTLTEVDKFIDVGMQMGIHPDDPDRLIKEELLREIDKEEFISRCSAVYTEHFTDDELDDLIGFYRTETGQKIVQVMPDVMKEIVQVSQQIAEETIARLEEKEGSVFHEQKQKTDAFICRNNLRMIDMAKDIAALELALSNGSSVTEKQISGHIKDGYSSLECPSGGAYGIGPIGEPPTCTVTSHALPELSFPLPGFSQIALPEEEKDPRDVPSSEAKPSTYIIRPGDTLSGIARKFDTTISEIKRLNQLDSNSIRAGDTLTLPMK